MACFRNALSPESPPIPQSVVINLYIKAVQKLKNALNDIQRHQNSDVLLAIALLQLVEVSLENNSQSI
jgi:hypothetical protein